METVMELLEWARRPIVVPTYVLVCLPILAYLAVWMSVLSNSESRVSKFLQSFWWPSSASSSSMLMVPAQPTNHRQGKSKTTAVFVHFRKCGGTSVVNALTQGNMVKFPALHKNGNAWQLPPLSNKKTDAQIVRFWDLDRDGMNRWLRQISDEGVTAFACEWGVPRSLLDLASIDSHSSLEFFTCMRNPYARFKSEFEFHDRFYIDISSNLIRSSTSSIPSNLPHAVSRQPIASISPILVPESRKGVKASEWIHHNLYWHRDNLSAFRVSINRPNFYVRMLCGLATDPDAELGARHLARAKLLLDRFVGIIILEDDESHLFMKRYGFEGSTLPKVLGRGSAESSIEKKDPSLMDISEEEFNELNTLDVELYRYAYSKRYRPDEDEPVKVEVHQPTLMEHATRRLSLSRIAPSYFRDPVQDQIMSETDIVIPLKRRGAIFRAVLGAVHNFYRPRRIVVISGKTDLEWLSLHLPKWRSLGEVGAVELADEETLFSNAYGFTRSSLKAYFEASANKLRSKPPSEKANLTALGEREFGWWYQQLIKLGAGSLLKLSSTYIVWDADLIPLKRWKLCDVASDGVTPRFFTAVLQLEARSPALSNEYDQCLKILVGLETVRPQGGGTFVTHHMAINQDVCNQLTNVMEARRNGVPWPLAILGMASECTRFSEYLTYASFASALNLPNAPFEYHPVSEYGVGGIRMRGGLHIVDALVTATNVAGHHDVYGGFSYEAFCNFAQGYFEKELPPYVQLDHVYVDPHQGPLVPLYPPPAIGTRRPKSKQSGTIPNNKRTSSPPNSSTGKMWEYEPFYVNSASTFVATPEQNPEEVSKAVEARREKLLQRQIMWWEHFLRTGYIFVHIPKNAGTSVESLFLGADAPPTSQHFTARELRRQNPSEFNRLLKFCVVRNPYDRFLSAYTYLMNGGNNKPGSADLMWKNEIAKYETFAEFVFALFPEKNGSRVPDWRSSSLPSHFVPQNIFVCGNRGEGHRLLVDKIVYMSDLCRNPEQTLKECGIHLVSQTEKLGTKKKSAKKIDLPHLRKSAPRCAGFDSQVAKVIYDVYRRDFELFGFRKESWKRWPNVTTPAPKPVEHVVDIVQST